VHHCEKSFFYYIEFIRQIDEDNHTLLKLNSTDATYFVFKKTIYEINDEYRKKITQLDEEGGGGIGGNGAIGSDGWKITRTNKMIDIYNRILVKVSHSTILIDGPENEQLVRFKNKTHKSADIFLHYLQGENENEDRFFELLNVTETFVLYYKNDNKCIVPYLDVLLKKIKKKVGKPDNKSLNSSEILVQLSKNIQRALFTNHVDENDNSIENPSKYINLLFR
jgi:hypothetical protein